MVRWMSYDFYKILHFTGLFVVFSAMGGQLACFLATGAEKTPTRKFMGLLQGIGLLIVLVAGFGLIVRLDVGFPLWVLGKLGVWLALGMLPVVAAKKPERTRAVYILMIALGVVAAYLARIKPL